MTPQITAGTAALANIRDQRISEPALIALAGAGFVAYGLLGWAGWHAARRARAGLGEMPALLLYLAAMAGLFLHSSFLILRQAAKEYRTGEDLGALASHGHTHDHAEAHGHH